MHKPDEYVPFYSEGNHAVMQLSSIAPSNSIRSLFNNNLMSNVWGRVLSGSIVPYTGKKKQIHTHNSIGGCAIGFLPCRINWNHIFGWELSIRLVERSEEDITEGREKRMIKREGGWMRDMGNSLKLDKRSDGVPEKRPMNYKMIGIRTNLILHVRTLLF